MTASITPDERAAMRALADAATEGPWEAGEHYHVQAEDRCRCLPDYGPLVGINPDGKYGRMHVHRRAEARWDEGVTARDDNVGGRAVIVETSEYGLMTPEDRAFIAAARTAVPRLLDALDTAEAEVARLREEAARPAPVWDEDAAALAVFERSHEPPFEDSEEGMRGAKRFVRSLAVVREHLPVRTDRETIERALLSASGDWDMSPLDRSRMVAAQTHAVLAEWPGESRATVQAEALHDAAEEIDRLDFGPDQDKPFSTGARHKWGAMQAAERVRARADRLDPRESGRG